MTYAINNCKIHTSASTFAVGEECGTGQHKEVVDWFSPKIHGTLLGEQVRRVTKNFLNCSFKILIHRSRIY